MLLLNHYVIAAYHARPFPHILLYSLTGSLASVRYSFPARLLHPLLPAGFDRAFMAFPEFLVMSADYFLHCRRANAALHVSMHCTKAGIGIDLSASCQLRYGLN